jgi:CubicO group peptidase (beta-lactamase class C family)
LNHCLTNTVEFFAGFTHRAPVYLPGTTPSFSNAGFQILAYALESMAGKSFDAMLNDSILQPLIIFQTFLSTPPDIKFGVIPGNKSGWDTTYGEDPALSMYSSLHDIAIAGIAMLSFSLISPAATRRWLKPISLTSNLVNSQGRPWEIYGAVAESSSPVTEIYTAIGSTGHYSSYIGLVPNYNVGFAMLAADSETSADLNAYVDFISEALQTALEKTAIVQANASYAGTYTSSNSTMNIEAGGDTGLSVTILTYNGTDVLTGIAT